MERGGHSKGNREDERGVHRDERPFGTRGGAVSDRWREELLQLSARRLRRDEHRLDERGEREGTARVALRLRAAHQRALHPVPVEMQPLQVVDEARCEPLTSALCKVHLHVCRETAKRRGGRGVVQLCSER
eukprot:3278169-Prymnesium_polylepis.1